ncbi:MAG: EamA family transporter [Lachnospiraceae bacterium]|nr:EamA family transporter [Lachnospiraceae bacterium]
MHSSKQQIFGHVLALFTVFIWGTTFVATKLLLADFSPVAILFYRFFVGYIMLWIIYPHKFQSSGIKEEVLYFAAGASGVTIYFLCENFALTYTYASNVSIIVATAPFLTGWLVSLFYKERMSKNFIIGFLLAIVGIAIVSFNGSMELSLNPFGDLLAFLAAFCWAVYSVFATAATKYDRSSMAITRRIFFYGLLTMIPVLPFCDFQFEAAPFRNMTNLGLLLYLGLIASGLCYITWNKAMEYLGAVKTSVYIYLNPVVTVVFSFFILGEQLTLISVIGCILILLGLLLSEKKG